jgi:hypothetical protein
MAMTSQSGPDDPLYDVVGEPLRAEVVEELIRRQTERLASERKAQAWDAYDIYRNRIEKQVLRAISLQQNSQTIARDMARLRTKVRNDAADITGSIACVWKNGAERHIGTENEAEVASEAEAALLEVIRETDWDSMAGEVNQLAWLQGPQFAVPYMRGKEARIDVLGPHVYDVVQNIEDPYGMPVGLAWRLGGSADITADEHHVFVLDSFSLRRYVVKQGMPAQLADEPVEHDYGRLPAACLRFTRPMAGDDWYLVDAQSRLTSGTIDVGVLMARMGLVRRCQNHNLLTIIGRLDSMPKGQEAGDSEGAIVANAESKGGGAFPVQIDTKPYDVDPINFIRHVLFLVQSMVEPYGGHVQVDSGQPEIFGKVIIPPQVQAEHRKQQIKPALKFEADLWAACVAMLRAESHPLAAVLPDPDTLRASLRVNFGELSREVEDPTAAIAVNDWNLSRGLTSEIGIMRQRLGGATEAEAKLTIERNMRQRAWFNELAARENLPTKPNGETQTTPEANGAMGTPAREENRAAEAAQGDAAAAGQQAA